MSATARAADIERLEEAALSPLRHAGRGWWAVTGLLLLVVAIGLFGYATQLRGGLAETGMRDKVIWGFYVTNFVFFIGISHAGTLISAILRVTQAEWRRPITRMAEVITAIALMIGGSMVIIDLGRPDRIPNLIRYGRLESPIIWDLISVATYLAGSLIYLYLPLVPDIALCRDRLGAAAGRWRSRLYRVLALGWSDTPEQRQRLERAIGIMMILIIPIAVSVHTVVSWIFGMTLRAGWNSTIFGPYFVIGAIFSGVAAIITVMGIFRKVCHLEEYLTLKHFQYLGYLLLALTAIYAYFTLAEYLTTGYKVESGDKPLLHELLSGRYAAPFWGFGILGIVVPAVLLALPRTRTIPGIVLASVLVNIGMWLKRFVIVVPSLGLPLMPYEWGVYWPTWVEISITAAAFAGFALLFVGFARLFPMISVWEVREGWERAAAPQMERPEAAAAAVPVGGGGR